MYNNFLVEIYMGLSWDIKWHRDKFIYPSSTRVGDNNTFHKDRDIIDLTVDSLPSLDNFYEMVELKTGRLFKLSLDLYTTIIDQNARNESIIPFDWKNSFFANPTSPRAFTPLELDSRS